MTQELLVPPPDDLVPVTLLPIAEVLGEWQLSKTDKWYRKVRLEDGRECVVYESGVLHYGPDHGMRGKGMIKAGPSNEFTPEHVKELWAARREKAQVASTRGLVAAYERLADDQRIPTHGDEPEYDAWAQIVASRALLAMSMNGRDGTDAARWIGAITGMTGAERDAGKGGDEGTITLHATGRKALQALEILAQANRELQEE